MQCHGWVITQQSSNICRTVVLPAGPFSAQLNMGKRTKCPKYRAALLFLKTKNVFKVTYGNLCLRSSDCIFETYLYRKAFPQREQKGSKERCFKALKRLWVSKKGHCLRHYIWKSSSGNIWELRFNSMLADSCFVVLPFVYAICFAAVCLSLSRGAANPVNSPNVPCIFDAYGRVGICGDWLLGSNLEAAALSGMAMANQVGLRTVPQFFVFMQGPSN